MRRITALLCLAILFGCIGSEASSVNRNPEVNAEEKKLDELRGFRMGVVLNPKNGNDATFEDVVEAYQEGAALADVTMLWQSKQGIGQCELLKNNRAVEGARNFGIEPVITLGFATIKQVPGKGLAYVIDAPEGVNASLSDPEFRKKWVEEAGCIAAEFKPEYLSLGNEINDYFYMHPDELENYMTLYDEAYAAVKKQSPDTKVFAVLSYDHLVDNEQWSILEELDKRSDIIGLTTYPWKRFETPGAMDEEYYSQITKHSETPIVFTEIGWISSGEAGGTEKEQAAFLRRFFEITDEMNVEMVNWLFLHDAELSGFAGAITAEETGTIALKRMDGTEKPVYDVWVSMKGRKKE